MKGMSQTLYIVVAAVVILVAALVVITIFAGGVSKFNTVLEARGYCSTIAQPICSISDNEAAVVAQLQNIKIDIAGSPSNCQIAVGSCSCMSKVWVCPD